MDFIDEENDFAMVLQLFDEAPQTFLKLTSVLRACHDGCHIECHDAFVGNHVWHLAPDDALRQSLDEGRFADAGFANQNGIVLLSSGENLRHALYLPAASDDGVQHAVACRLRQVSAEVVDDGRIAFTPAVELSYLNEQEQYDLLEQMELNDCTPSLSQACRFKRMSAEQGLTPEVIAAVLCEEKANQREMFKVPMERIRQYVPNANAKQAEDFVLKACEHYHKFLIRQRNRDER